MDDKTRVIIVVVVLFIVGLPLLANFAGGKKAEPSATAPAPDAPPPAAQPAPPPTPMPQAPPPPQPQPVMMPPQPPPRPMGPPPPMSVANTVWTVSHPQAGNVTIQFFANGTAQAQSDRLPMQVQGTWQQNGNNVSFSSPMGNVTAQMNGDQMSAMGSVARRLR